MNKEEYNLSLYGEHNLPSLVPRLRGEPGNKATICLASFPIKTGPMEYNEIGHGLRLGSYMMELDKTTMYIQLQVLTDNSYPPRHVQLVSELTFHPTTRPFPLNTTWISSNRGTYSSKCTLKHVQTD